MKLCIKYLITVIIFKCVTKKLAGKCAYMVFWNNITHFEDGDNCFKCRETEQYSPHSNKLIECLNVKHQVILFCSSLAVTGFESILSKLTSMFFCFLYYFELQKIHFKDSLYGKYEEKKT